MNPFQSLRDYEEFIYTIKQRHSYVQKSTLTVVRRGKRTAVVQDEIAFAKGYRIVVKERISIDNAQVSIESYGYKLWCYGDKTAWYDSQPHPHDPNLADTYPHHKHILPNIKHNRSPAPKMHFNQPNLPFLIHEVEALMKE